MIEERIAHSAMLIKNLVLGTSLNMYNAAIFLIQVFGSCLFKDSLGMSLVFEFDQCKDYRYLIGRGITHQSLKASLSGIQNVFM